MARGFLELPGEIRNEIYFHCIGNATVGYVVNWTPASHKIANSNTGSLALSRSCKQVREEYICLWKSATTVKINFCQLSACLQQVYPSTQVNSHANVHLLLPPQYDRVHNENSFVDITQLFKLMTQSAHFNLTVGSTPYTFELPSEVSEVDTEAQELQDILYNVRKQAQSLLDTIFAVRLGLVKRELPQSWRHDQLIEQRLPYITFLFEEHSNAHDLNHESALAWKQWLEDSGASSLKKWKLRAEAQSGVKEPQNALQSAGRTHNSFSDH